MIRTFITTISMQGKGDLKKVFYEPVGFELKNNMDTSFPIIPVIASKMDNKEDVKIIAIRTENGDTRDNFEKFNEELGQFGFKKMQIKEISIEENQSKVLGMKMMMTILQEIPEDSLVYADITFGTKPMAALTLYAMNFIEKIKDAEVEGIYYGEIPRENKEMKGKAQIYELTAYKYLSDVLEQLKNLKLNDPLAAMQKLLNI